MRRWFFAVLAGLFLNQASALLRFELTQGLSAPLHLSLTTQGHTDDLAEDQFIDVVKADLARTGSMTWDTEDDEVDYAVTIEVQHPAPEKDYQLNINIHPKSQGAKHDWQNKSWANHVSAKQLRAYAHHTSDNLYQAITGKPGIAATRIAYVLVSGQDPNKNYQLQVADSDGENAQTLLKTSQPIISPTWSHDGKSIAYVSMENHRNQIFIQNLATGKRRMLAAFDGLNNAPAWSPDGNTLAIVLTKDGAPNIYLLSLVSHKLDRLTYNWAIDTEPTWTPDGRTIYFTSGRAGAPQIYRADLVTRHSERVTYMGPYNARPAITPDGNTLVFLHQSGKGYSIATMNIETTVMDVITSAGRTDSPSISANGQWVLYADRSSGKSVLGLVSIDGKVQYRLPTDEGEVRQPAWSPYLH